MNKKVVSFSLWGSHPAYCVGAIENAKIIGHKIYEDWESWFYLGNDVTARYVTELKKFASKIIFVNNDNFTLAFERFSSIFDPGVKISVSRDADSRVSDKEYQAVLEWEKSSFPLHAMRDHDLHCWPVMAGMWGIKCSSGEHVIKSLKSLYAQKSNEFESDQVLLRIFYEEYKELFFLHGKSKNFNGANYPEHLPFNYGSYIGERIDENNIPGSSLKSFSKEGY